MAGASTNLGLILPVVTDATIVRDIYNTNWETIDAGVQMLDTGLTSIAALTTAVNKMIYTTALDTYAVTSLTAFARTILDDANEATFKATVNLEIGTDVQAYDADLSAIAALAKTDSNFIVGNGTTWVVESGATARTSLGAAASGANSDITSMTGLGNDGIPLAKVANAASDGANSDITSLSGITGAIATATNISLTGELDLTGALATIDLNPANQTTKDIITITPSATLNATQVWCGINIDGSALDPNGVDTEIIGYQVNLSGIDETNSPIIHGARLNVPFGSDALHIAEGQLHIDTVLPNTAASEFTNIDIVIDSSDMVATSEYHAIDVATTGTPAGNVVAMGTHAGIEVIHQHIASFATPSQTEFAGVKHTGGTVWVDGIDAYGGVIFAAASDAIYVGGAAQFDEIEVIMTTGGTKSIQPTFWYNTAADAWTQFFPADDTDGFQQSGEIRWEVAGITANWTNNGDPGVGDTTAGYWIKIVRTRAGTVGSPDPATVKIGTGTDYFWNKTGDLTIKDIDANDADFASLILDTALAIAEGGTGVTTGAMTGITSVLNTALYIGRDADNQIKFATDNQITFRTSGADNIKIDANGNLDLQQFAILLDDALGSDHDYSGLVDSADVGESVVFGDLLYYDWADVEWKKAKADAIGTTPAMRIALESKSNGQACLMLVQGYIRDDSAFDFGASRVFLNDDTAGACDDTAPAESGDQIQVVGIAISQRKMYFNPSVDVGEI